MSKDKSGRHKHTTHTHTAIFACRYENSFVSFDILAFWLSLICINKWMNYRLWHHKSTKVTDQNKDDVKLLAFKRKQLSFSQTIHTLGRVYVYLWLFGCASVCTLLIVFLSTPNPAGKYSQKFSKINIFYLEVFVIYIIFIFQKWLRRVNTFFLNRWHELKVLYRKNVNFGCTISIIPFTDKKVFHTTTWVCSGNDSYIL